MVLGEQMKLQELKEAMERQQNEADGEEYPVKLWPTDILALIELVEAQHEALTEATDCRCGHVVNMADEGCLECKACSNALVLYDKFNDDES